MKTNTLNSVLLFCSLFLCFFIASYLGTFKALPVLGSVGQGSEYYATTTRSSAGVAGPTTVLIKGGYGSLGTIILTGAAAGQIDFYDATTSDITKRASQFATSSILLSDITASVVAGNYVHDIVYGRGLLMVITGTAPTSTVTYR